MAKGMNDEYIQKLTWDEVEDVSQEAFNIENDWSGLAWGKLAWENLTRVEATVYITGMDRAQLGIRFLALADIYRDFCSIVWQKRYDSDYYEWAEALEISQLRVGQLVGLNPEIDDSSDTLALYDAVQHLAKEARRDVVHDLSIAFRGERELFISLLYSIKDGNGNESGCCPAVEDLDDLVGAKLTAFKWFKQGCPPCFC